MSAAQVKVLAGECGFALAGVAAAGPVSDFARYESWIQAGHAGGMRYLTDHRAQIRRDVRNLLPAARSVIVVGKLYNSADTHQPGDARIARYAWSRDYHLTMAEALTRLAQRIAEQVGDHQYKVCVDSAPLLERSLAREAGLGWIGKNTCLINEPQGSWFLLGEMLTSLDLEPDAPPPDRCGSCTRCIDACPTAAFVPAETNGTGGTVRWTLDSRRCISYLTIEHRGPIPPEHHAGIGDHVFGCDICQEVCPWNRRAPVDEGAAPHIALSELAAMDEAAFRSRFRDTAIYRTKYAGLRRNVEIVQTNKAHK